MRGFRSFKGRIVTVILVSAVPPLLIGLFLASEITSLGVSLAFNPQIEQAVIGAAGIYPEVLRARRAEHELALELTAIGLGGDSQPGATADAALEGACARFDSLEALRLVQPGRPERSRRCREEGAEIDRLELTHPVAGGGELHGVFTLPHQVLARRDHAESWAEHYVALQEEGSEIRTAYLRAYFLVLGLWALLAGLVGFLIARRATDRIASLARVTAEVRGGDLTARVAVEGRDELSALAVAFNGMVSELDQRGARIVYLEKISSWQGVAQRLAHEIKNPLTPILLAVQQLHSRYRGEDPAFQRLSDEALEIVTEEVETLRRLVSEFSSFARLPSAAPEPVELRRFLEGFCRRHPELGERAHLELQLPDAPLWAAIDRTLMGRVLDNLISNSVEAASEEGERPPTITLALQDEAEATLSLQIRDQGPGIPPADLPSLFDPYFTTKATGTGLGLAICKKIILEHQGSVEAHNLSPRGACFEIRLPTCPPPQAGEGDPEPGMR